MTDRNAINPLETRTDWRVYHALVSSIASGASASTSFNIRAHADFEIHKISYMTDIAGAVQTESSRVLPLVTVQITDTGAGKEFFDDPVPIPAICGTGPWPHYLPGPRRVAAKSTLQFTFYNYSAATTYANLYLLLDGVEVYL